MIRKSLKTWIVVALSCVLLALPALQTDAAAQGSERTAEDSSDAEVYDIGSDIGPEKESPAAQYAGYEISAYDVDVRVNRDNTYDIRETITARYIEPRHGIIREIPETYDVCRDNGETDTVRARITDVSVDGWSEVTREGDYVEIRVGNPDREETGAHTYQISYRLDPGRDTLDDGDEFYYNLIGTSWDTQISNVTFAVTMPENLTQEEIDSIGFTSGYSGSNRIGDTLYDVDERTISGRLMRSLADGEGYTIRVTLPEGYYQYPFDWGGFFSKLIPLLGVLAAFVLWFLHGRDERPVPTVEFYPPEGYNSLDVAMAWHGEVRKRDVTSLLVYLASKGYLGIIDKSHACPDGNGPHRGVKLENFQIQKIRDYDGANESERLFMMGLFPGTRERVSKKQLTGHFYKTTDRILDQEKEGSAVYRTNFTGAAKKYNPMLVGIAAAVAFLGLFIMMVGSRFSIFGSFIVSVIWAGVSALAAALIGMRGRSRDMVADGAREVVKLAAVFWKGIIFFGIFFLTNIISGIASIFSVQLPIALGFSALCTAGIIFFMRIMPKRTPEGTRIYGQIRGFKTFLETAEKERLEMLVNDDPQYFYDILPYAYVLGVSDKWMKKFESINIPAPDFVLNPDRSFRPIDYWEMRWLMHEMNDGFYYASVNEPVHTGSPGSGSGHHGGGFTGGSGSFGGSSGGGFSGGGSGGGGGSSW